MHDSAPWVTTSTVLERLKSGRDDDAWGAFVTRFRGPILAYAQRQGLSAADAEDAVQEALAAFVAALRSGRFVRERGRLSHWLYGFASLAIRSTRTRVGGAAAAQLSDWSGVEGTGHLDPQWEEQWERAVLEHCLSVARTEFRGATWSVFEQLALEGHSVDDVAARAGMTRNAVYIAKHRVLARVEALIAECDTPFATPTAPGAVRGGASAIPRGEHG